MRSTLIRLSIAAGAGGLLGYAISTVLDVGPATPFAAVFGVVCILVVISAATQGTRSDLPAQLHSEHGWFWHELTRELDRSRRHGCEFVLVRVHAPRSPLERALPDGAVGLPPMPQRAGALAAYLRGSDRTWEGTDGHVYIILPETRLADAEALLLRITQSAPHLLPSAGFSTVTFPHDGVTSGALLASLRNRRPSTGGDRDESASDTLAAGAARSSDADRGAA